MNISLKTFKRIFTFAQLILIAFAAASAIKAQTSGVDLSFNAIPDRNLNTTTNFILQPDNKIIVFGDFQVVNGVINNRIARLNTDGSVDNTFNCTSCDFTITSAVVQPDGKIIIAGNANTGNALVLQPRIYRLNADGSRDTSFTSPFPVVVFPESDNVDVRAVQPDGKILVVLNRRFSNSYNYTLYRLNPNGTIDNTFTPILVASGSGGIFGQSPGKISLLPDGKILAVTNSFANCPGCTPGNATLKRYNADGTVDATFEPPSATVASNVNGSALINDFDVQSDGSVIIVGRFTAVNGVSRLNVAKILPAGNVDLSFSSSNIGEATKVKILPNDKILISTSNRFYRLNTDGSLDNSFTSPTNLTLINNWMLDSAGRIFLSGIFLESGVSVNKFARLNQDGSIESSLTATFGVAGGVSAIAVQPNGKVVFAGGFIRVNGIPSISIARVNADGSLDSTFNTGSGFNNPPTIILVQLDGKILCAGGFIYFNGIWRPRLVRLNADGSLDNTFAPNLDAAGEVNTMVLQSDGKILIGGRLQTVGGQGRDGFFRLNADGSFDTSFNPVFGSATIRSIVVQSDGKIMVGGSFDGVNGFNRTNLVRLNSDGSLDNSFNAGSISPIKQIEVQTDGRYLILTNTIIRLNNNGTTDATFLSPTFNGLVNQFLTQPDGSILVGGNFSLINNSSRLNFARLKPNGTLDSGFFPGGANGEVRTIVRQADGRILVGGDFSIIGDVMRLSIARLNVSPFRTITPFDFDGDGKADLSVFRLSNGVWYRLNSSSNQQSGQQFGANGDQIVPADYDGDGKTDLAVFRNGTWYIQRSSQGFTGVAFGTNGDLPVPTDYDGDGKADIAVYRPSNGVWYIQRSLLGYIGFQFGIVEDKPTLGDFDGDGKSDIAVFRPSTGYWYRINSSTGQWSSIQFGAAGDLVVPADYDGDGKTDIAVFRPSSGVWYIQRSALGFIGVQLGDANDKPAPADYDGDGKADIAVYRPSNGVWYVLRSTQEFTGVQFGVPEDKPIPNAFVR
ncbi:MAG: FG-GAP-like repeat-containing protein [Acidobacteria bacterium]|nr:FG-GAP-like repeat-containing protein [Acidobacteriota bacterium]MCA1638721.1 FG-GAP-like repeat-containing protein [Acidobacteriota bacterium]